jgi:hypothetical protein
MASFCQALATPAIALTEPDKESDRDMVSCRFAMIQGAQYSRCLFWVDAVEQAVQRHSADAGL